MLDRRTVLMSGAASAALAMTPVLAKAAAAANPEATKMNAMFDQFMSDVFDQAPECTTNLDIDKGDRAYQRSLVSDRSLVRRVVGCERRGERGAGGRRGGETPERHVGPRDRPVHRRGPPVL